MEMPIIIDTLPIYAIINAINKDLGLAYTEEGQVNLQPDL